jgi:predicted transposase YbfD/YdcC
VLALKENQPTLHNDVAEFLNDPVALQAANAHTDTDAGHGRIEQRTATVSTDIDWLQEMHHWPHLAAIGKVTRCREINRKATTETAYYLLSAPLTARRLNEAAREHWCVENQLHWRLDVTFNEDQSRVRKDNGPYNLAILRHMALNIVSKETSKGSARVKLKRAGWNDAFLAKLLARK